MRNHRSAGAGQMSFDDLEEQAQREARTDGRLWWTTVRPACDGCGNLLPRNSRPGPRSPFCEECRAVAGRRQRTALRRYAASMSASWPEAPSPPPAESPRPATRTPKRRLAAPKRRRLAAPPPPVEGSQAFVYSDHPEAMHSAVLGAFVYRCKDASGRVIYVGSTSSHPTVRLKDHKSQHRHRVSGRHAGEPWYHLMTSIDWIELPTVAEARAEEHRQILIHNPIGNVLLRPDDREAG